MQSLVFIPTYNERGNIENLINQILNLNLDINILIVDDNSPDGTGRLVDEISRSQPRLFVIHRFDKRGRGLAGIAGFKYAIEKNADYIIEMDADLSHPPRYIPIFLQEIKDCDVVIGSRRVQGGKMVGVDLRRKCLTLFAQYFCRFILGIKILDATSGFRCFKRDTLVSINLDKLKSIGPSIVEEINLSLQNKGFKFKEVPIVFESRAGGVSKLNLKKVLSTFRILLRIKFGR